MNKYQEALLVQAIQYARRGWHVLPCTWKKHPLTANGFYDATTDEDQIIKWWEENPKSLIGIRTGKESGFWVVDVDMKNGKNGLESLTGHFGDQFDIDLENDLVQKTATGGFHFCFKYGEQQEVGCGVEYLPGVDVRGDGGYIIAAPSSIKVGDEWKEYKWKDINAEPRGAPKWAYDLLTLRPHNKERLNLDAILKDGVSEGARDVSIFKIACMLEREGVDMDTARVFIQLLAENCSPPFDTNEATEKVNRAYTDYRTPKGIQAQIDALTRKREEMKNGN